MATPPIEEILRSRARLHGMLLPEPLVPKLVAYYALLARWNARMNLTSLMDPEQAVDRLLLEPAKAGQSLPSGKALLDLGSGGGSPAIPLALTTAAKSLTMVESKARKAAFLREALRSLGIHGSVECDRYESVVPQLPTRMDVISVRAVKIDDALLELIGDALVPTGQIVLFVSDPPAVPARTGLIVDRTVALIPTLRSKAIYLKRA